MIYRPGLLTGRLSGTAGSTLASANPTAATITTGKAKKPKVTSFTAQQKANFTAIANAYRALIPSDAAAWVAFGQTLIFTGRLARTYALPGAAAFMSVNQNRLNMGLSILTVPPSLLFPTVLGSLSGSAQAPPTGPFALSITTTPNTVPSDSSWFVYASYRANSSVTSPHRKSAKLIQVLAPNTIGPFNILAAYQARLLQWFPGDQIPIFVTPCLQSSGIVAPFAFSFVLST